MRPAQPPAGTVTFLFTDIEGSTKLWEAHPEPMRVALARHDALVREAIADAGGHVFKTVGDAFCTAFAVASDALGAALAAQLALMSEPWEERAPIRARMALHTGAVETRDHDYFGLPVNRVARLLSTGHGGQILLSQATHELTRDSLPASASLREMGEHRLKDLGRPESVFQLLHPQLPYEFPALRSLDNPDLKHNLPQQLNNFVGRERELAEVKELLAKTRLLTLTGAGGSGKTRLSLQVAADQLESFEDGAWFVELATLADPNLVHQAVASQLGLKEEPGKAMSQTLPEHLKGRRLFLILDNCEHVLDACAKMVDTLIRQCPQLQILASSRERLGITGEQTYRVPSLPLPSPDEPHTAASLSQYEAVQLFVDRAVLVRPDFQVTNQNAPALASLCVHLDGIPLAIELAAARVRSLSVEEIDGKLDQRFRLLTGGSRTALPRQQTLRALVDWSYQMLTELEREALEQLSVFVGGWTLEMAEKTCGDPISEFDLLDLITALVDKSLVNFEMGEHVRYTFFETIREFAREHLAARPEAEAAAQRRHAESMAEFAMERFRKFRTAEEPASLHELVRNAPNVVAALAWARQQANLDLTARLSLALSAAHQRRGYPREGTALIEDLLGTDLRVSELEPELHAMLLCEQASLALDLFENHDAAPLAERAAAIAQGLDNVELKIRAQNLLGQVAMALGKFVQTREHFEEALRLSEEAKLWADAARLRNNLGIVERRDPTGDKALAAHHYRAALEIQREQSDRRGEAETLNSLGVLEQDGGHLAEAASLYLEAARIETDLEHPFGVAKTLSNYAETLAAMGDPAGALRPFAIAEQLFGKVGSPYREYTKTLLEGSARTLGWSDVQIEEFRASCGRVELKNAVTASLQEE